MSVTPIRPANPYPAPLRLSQEPSAYSMIAGHGGEIEKALDETGRLEMRERELVSEGATETHATCDLSLVRMRLRSLPDTVAWHLKNTRELRKLNKLAPHVLDRLPMAAE